MTTKPELMALIDQRDELDAKIEAAMTELKIDAKQVKAIRKEQARIAASQKTLNELMGIDPKTAEQIKAD